MKIPETTWAWLAALIDGEGSIMMTQRTPTAANRAKFSNQPHYRYVVSVCNTKLEILEEIRRRVGVGRIYEHKMSPSRTRSNRVYTWRMNSTEIVQHLPHILPWLILKRRQAGLLLEAIEIAQQNTPTKGQRFDWSAVNVRLVRRGEIYLTIRELNRTGVK